MLSLTYSINQNQNKKNFHWQRVRWTVSCKTGVGGVGEVSGDLWCTLYFLIAAELWWWVEPLWDRELLYVCRQMYPQLLEGLDVLQTNTLSSLKQEFIAHSITGTYRNLTAQDFTRFGIPKHFQLSSLCPAGFDSGFENIATILKFYWGHTNNCRPYEMFPSSQPQSKLSEHVDGI